MTPDTEMSTADRRALLATTPNPGERLDYMVMLEGSVVLGGSGQRVAARLSYIADRRVLSLDAFNAYLDAVAQGVWPTLEAAAISMLGDMNNELIPRWAQIRLVAGPGDRDDSHSVVIEDRQPGWDNPTLLARHGR